MFQVVGLGAKEMESSAINGEHDGTIMLFDDVSYRILNVTLEHYNQMKKRGEIDETILWSSLSTISNRGRVLTAYSFNDYSVIQRYYWNYKLIHEAKYKSKLLTSFMHPDVVLYDKEKDMVITILKDRYSPSFEIAEITTDNVKKSTKMFIQNEVMKELGIPYQVENYSYGRRVTPPTSSDREVILLDQTCPAYKHEIEPLFRRKYPSMKYISYPIRVKYLDNDAIWRDKYYVTTMNGKRVDFDNYESNLKIQLPIYFNKLEKYFEKWKERYEVLYYISDRTSYAMNYLFYTDSKFRRITTDFQVKTDFIVPIVRFWFDYDNPQPKIDLILAYWISGNPAQEDIYSRKRLNVKLWEDNKCYS